MTDQPANTVCIYGASDDLIEFEGAIDGEEYLSDDESTVTLTGPDGKTLDVLVTFCGANRDGWSVTVTGSRGSTVPSWRLWFGPRPGAPESDDVALWVEIPDGTTATCDGEPVE